MIQYLVLAEKKQQSLIRYKINCFLFIDFAKGADGADGF